MQTYKWLWKYLKKYSLIIVINIILTIIMIGFVFFQPIVLGELVSKVVYEKNISVLPLYASLIILAIILKEIINYICVHLYESVAQKVVFKIRCNIFKKLESLDLKFFENNHTGDIMSALTMDTDCVKDLLATGISLTSQYLALTIIGLSVIFCTQPHLGLYLLIPIPFIVILSFSYMRFLKPHYDNLRRGRAELNQVCEENISGNRVVKAYSRESFEEKKLDIKSKQYYKFSMNFVYIWNKHIPLITFFCHLETIIFLIISSYLLINKNLTLGQFTTINGILWCITSPFSQLGNLFSKFKNFSTSSSKLIKIENQQTSIGNTHKIMKKGTGINGKIQFKNVTLYHESYKVLTSMNFTVKPGQTLGIIGPTGSGKTSIVNLIGRFYEPQFGTVYIDDINVKNIDLETLRTNISYAMQDVFLFSDTIKNNISYGVPDATDDDIFRVSKIANAHDFIIKLPDGYNTIVGERGVGLSGGQRQRLSLARALLKNPSILILDDTTSAIDMETEHNIQKSLNDSFFNKTKIIIAHRISSVKNADLILVVNKGHIVEWGTHQDLINQNGYYKTACDNQFGDFNQIKDYKVDFPAIKANMGGEK